MANTPGNSYGKTRTRVHSGSSDRKKRRKNSKPSMILTSNNSNPKNSTQLAMKEVDYSIMNSFSQSFGKEISPNAHSKSRSRER